ncbi:MAG: PTS sugar transporter subunit IIA [Gammaproteobacteria bacterium]|nr:PTS sugar transporter subunit IIA [Gammaproteobacteria bacterium]
MQLEEILTPERCFCKIEGFSKKRLLTKVSSLLGDLFENLDETEVFNSMMAREYLGSTGLGNGIAIPHCRVPQCETIIGSLVTLVNPVDYDAIDDNPVDLVFVLIVPEEKKDEHIRALSELAKLFNNPAFCQKLRETHNSTRLYQAATSF